MRPERANLKVLFEEILSGADAPMPAKQLLDEVERRGYLRVSAHQMVSRAFGLGMLVRIGAMPRYSYRLPRADDQAASTGQAETVLAVRVPQGIYVGPAFTQGHPPIQTGSPCGGDDELPPVLGAMYQQAVGRIFDRASGFIGEVE